VSAWYRIYRRRDALVQGKVYYTPYVDIASARSFEDAKQKVVKKKLRGIAKRVAMEVVKYFELDGK